MSKKLITLFLITISLLLSKISSKLNYVESEIVITSTMQSTQISHLDNLHLFSATFDKTLGKFLFFLLVPKDNENEYNHIFVSIPGDSEKIPTYKESDYKTVDKNTTLLIETQNIPNNINNAKITIECKESCDFTLYYQIVTIIPLINDRSFDLILNSNEEFVLEYEPESIEELNNKFTFFSNAPSDFTLNILYNESETISPLTEFFNGYGLFVDGKKYPDGCKFTFKLSHYGKPKELIHVSNRKLTKEIKNLAVGDFHNSITGIQNLDKECFNLPKISEEETDKNYNINFLTYTKNILITLDNTETFPINSESDVIQINAKKYSEICFSSNNEEIATTTFQILDGTEQTLNQDDQMPLYRGVPKKAKLLKGQIAYYRLYFYPTYSENIIMNLKSIEGKAKLYYGICSNYPHCNFQEDQLSTFETEKDINNNIFIKKKINENMAKPYSDPEFQVAIVYCTNEENEKDCEYFITMSNDNDEINIIENERYYSSIQDYQLDKYQFNVYDSKSELEYLLIYLYSYTGQGEITIYSDKEMTQEINTEIIRAVQNLQIAVIMATSLPDKTLHGNYYIKVKGLSNTVYSIYYSTESQKSINFYLSSNEVNIQAQKCDGHEINYYIKNKGIHKNVPFLLEFNSLNCDLEVRLTGESETITERYYQYIIDNTKSYYSNDYYELEIKAKKADIEGAPKEMLCLFAIMGGEIDENREILLSDGIIQKGKLTKNVNYINYLYTFILNSLDDELTLFFQKDSNYITDLSYAFENSDLTTYKVVNTEKRFVFSKNDFYEHCKHYNESCTLKIQIKINEKETLTDNSYVDFMLSINNRITYPSYLPKDKLIKNVLQTNQYLYYYLDIGKNEECDIILDFNEGFGQAIAKIVKKDEIEENPNYNRRVVLPLPGMQDNYIFDQYTKELKITKEMTSECDNGCEIYIAIFHCDQRYIDLISSFSIYYRKNNNIVYLPENTFGHGNLKSIDDKNIFRTKINKKTGMVIFNIIGEDIIVYINEGEEIPSSDSKDYILDSNNQKQLKINSDSFEGQIFTYVVTTSKFNNIDYRSYDIKIITPDSESINIESIDYLHNNPCYFNKENIKCNYILPVEIYSQEDKLYLFAPDNKNALIYANSISMEEFDSLTPEEKNQKLPKKPTDPKDYLIIDISERRKDIYILISIETSDTQNESIANLVVGGFYHASTSFLRPNAYSFYYIKNGDKNDNINLVIESNDFYSLSFVIISGTGIITQSEVKKKLSFGEYSNKIFTFSFATELKKQKLFTVQIESNNDINPIGELYFYTYLESNSYKSNIREIRCSDIIEQKFEYLKNEEKKNFFPLSFYEQIQKDTNEDKQFIIQVFDRLPVTSEFKEKQFIVSGYILNKTFIEDIKLNPEALEKEKAIINGEYNNNLLTSRIIFTKEIIEKYSIYDQNYLYVDIRNSNDEIIEFNYTEIDVLKSSFNFIDVNKYVTFKVEGKQNKNLLLVPEIGIYKMALEFFVDGKSDLREYSISVNIYYDDNTDYSRNSTSIIDDTYTYREFEKQYIMIHISQGIHYIVANVIKNNYNNEINNSYFLKYRVESSNPSNYYLDSNRSISYSLDNQFINMSHNPIKECQDCSGNENFKVLYFAKFYDYEKIGNKEIRNIIIDEEPLYEYNLTKNGSSKTNERIKWEVEIKEKNKTQLVQIIGYASFGDNEEIFVYNSFSFIEKKKEDEEKKEPEEEDEYKRLFEFYLILFSFIGTIIISFGGMYVYIYAKVEIGRMSLSSNKNISLIQSPSDRTTGKTNTRMTV